MVPLPPEVVESSHSDNENGRIESTSARKMLWRGPASIHGTRVSESAVFKISRRPQDVVAIGHIRVPSSGVPSLGLTKCRATLFAITSEIKSMRLIFRVSHLAGWPPSSPWYPIRVHALRWSAHLLNFEQRQTHLRP